MFLDWDIVQVLCKIFQNISFWKNGRAPAFDAVI